MYRLKMLATIWLISSLLNLNAQEKLTLEDALSFALENHHRISIARQEAEKATIENNWGAAGRLPSINLFVNSNNNYNQLNNPASFFTEAQSATAGLVTQLDVSWTLYNGSRVRLTKDQLENSEILGQNGIRQAVENTIAEVTRAYYTAQIQEEQISVLREVLDLSADQLRYVGYQQEFGQAVLFDKLQARDAYLIDSTNYVTQLSSYRTAIYDLNRSMGLGNMSLQYSLVDSLDRQIREYFYDDLYSAAEGRNTVLDNMHLMREIARLNAHLARANRHPNVSLSTGSTYNTSIANTDATFADGTMREFNGARSNNLNTYLNLNASMNLFNGGMAKQAEQTARIDEIIAQEQLLDMTLEISQGLQIALENYEQFVQLHGIAEELSANAAQNLELSRDRFRNGLINSFDYRTVQLSYLNARLQELNYLYNLRLAELDMLQLSGQLVTGD